MKVRRLCQTTITAMIVAAVAFQVPSALACSFDTQVYFSFDNHPDFPLKKFAAGQLGLLKPSYARSYLYIAERVLADEKLSSAEQAAAVAVWMKRLNSDYLDSDDVSGAKVWLTARNAITKPAIDQIYTMGSVDQDSPWQQFANIQADAFYTAAQTLKSLITKYGATSPQVKAWVQAQDDVFSNGGNPPYSDKKMVPKIPAPLPDNADSALKKDRSYQIAAANFYAGKFSDAVKQFDAIAADESSPWHKVAAYLAVRSLIRQASLAKKPDMALYVDAAKRIATLLDKSADAELKDSLMKLRDFVDVRNDPQAFYERSVKVPLTEFKFNELTRALDLTTGESDDYADGAQPGKPYKDVPVSIRGVGSLDWVFAVQRGDETALAHCLERWNSTHQVSWLVAISTMIEPKNKEAAEITSDMEKHLDPASPAYWTLLYNLNRLEIADKKYDLVRARLEKAIAAAKPGNLTISTLNELRRQQLQLAQSLDDIVKFGAETPAAVITSGGVDGVPDDPAKIEQSGKMPVEKAAFTLEAATIIDSQLPLKRLLELCKNKSLPAELRNHLIWSTWVRAILLSNDSIAKELAPMVKAANKSKAKYIDSFLASSNNADAKFAAADLILHFSSARPGVGSGVIEPDTYGDETGWWWVDKQTFRYDSDAPGSFHDGKFIYPPAFLSKEDVAQAKKELQQLQAVAVAPDYLAGIVLPYAKQHLSDPRVPEALNFFVKSTRYGSTDSKTKGYSKEAFNILHQNFKGNVWTKKTPYFY